MALRFLGVGALVGFGAGLSSGMTRPRSISCADAAPAPALSDPPVDTVKCVVIGGGYAGSRIAYQLDSVYHVTLIDKKNYFEASDELTSVLTGPESDFDTRLTSIHALHRYYLRRARVITNTAVDVSESEVKLADGRTIPYDILIVCPGEERPYPFAATALTVDVREAELKAYRQLLWRNDVRKIAVVGGGPRGSSLASCIANMSEDKEVHLFHSTSTFAPDLPYEARNRIDYILSNNPRITVHRNSVVAGVKYTNPPTVAAVVKVESMKQVSKVWSLFRRDSAKQAENSKAAVSPAPDTAAGSSADSPTETATSSSTTTPPVVPPAAPPVESSSPYLGAKFELAVSLRADTKKETPSVLYQAIRGDRPPTKLTRGAEVGTETLGDFDLVINCAGNMTSGRHFESFPMLAPHLDAKGQFIISKYSQLHGLPKVFSIGRSSNIDWVKSTGASDYQARALFRNLLSVANLSDSPVANFVPTMTPVSRKSLSFPRIIVPFDEVQAAGSIAWSGTVTGPLALKELMQDRQYFFKEFHKPIFFKQQEDAKVRQGYERYFATAATDPTDFEGV
jgi:thioredoxin reductase